MCRECREPHRPRTPINLGYPNATNETALKAITEATMKTLDYDTTRCAGRLEFGVNAKWCERRETCQRFMAWSEWDQKAGIPHYRGISVTMGRQDCGIKIEVST